MNQHPPKGSGFAVFDIAVVIVGIAFLLMWLLVSQKPVEIATHEPKWPARNSQVVAGPMPVEEQR